MKNIIQKIPLPICGVMLGFATLGNLLQSYGEKVRYACGILSCFLLILVLLKLILFPHMIIEDMKKSNHGKCHSPISNGTYAAQHLHQTFDW